MSERYCSAQELVVVLYCGALMIQGTGNHTMQAILKAAGELYGGGKTFCQSRISGVMQRTLEKEDYVIHNVLPRGKLFKHEYIINDVEKHKKKIRKMLGVKSIRETFSFNLEHVQSLVS